MDSDDDASSGMPKLESNSDFTVKNSYSYTTYGYTHLVYVVEAKQSVSSEVKLTITDKAGNVIDTTSDTISLTKGKKNYFDLVIETKNYNSSYKYSLKEKSSSSFWTGDTDAVEVVKYNKSDDNLYITVKQTKSNLGGFAKLKMLFFKGNKLINSEDCFYSIYADDLDGINTQAVMSVWIYGSEDYTNIEFFYEDR